MRKNRKASQNWYCCGNIGICILSGTTVFGYAPMQTTQTSDLTLLTETASFYDTATQDDTFKYSNIHFETEENTSIPVSESDLEPRAIICTHNF